MAQKRKRGTKTSSKSQDQLIDYLKDQVIKGINSQVSELRKRSPEFAKYENKAQEVLGRAEVFIRERPFLSVFVSFWIGKKIGKLFK